MRVALYGGTFDPIHHGHLILARDAIELLELDRVIFIPAAILGEPRFELDESELARTGPSYTIDTVEAMRARRPDTRLFYLIGHDNVAKLDTWHRIGDLRRLVEFIVFGRGEHDAPHPFPTLPRRVDISASEIRDRVARGASIRYLVPEPVRLLIEQHRLYRPAAPQP